MKPLGGVLAVAIAMLVWVSAGPAAGPGGWETVGGGMDDTVAALNTDVPGALLAGGRFTRAGTATSVAGIARYDGTTWTPLGPGLTGPASFVQAIAAKDGKIYAGGTFTGRLKAFDGTSWNDVCGGDPGGPVDALEIIGNTLFIGGAFSNAGGNPNADSLIKCDLATNAVTAVVDGPDDIVGRVKALAADSAGNLYAGGEFINLDGIALADYVAKYNGTSWSALGADAADPTVASINSANVDALTADGLNVYVGTDDDNIAGIPQADNIAKWDGSAWSALGSAGGDGFFPDQTRINAILVSGTKIYATGSFNDASGDPLADHVAVFDGTSWTHLGSNSDATNGPFIGEGFAMAAFRGAPIVGGGFTDAGGDTNADRLAAFPPPVATPTATPTTTPPILQPATVKFTDTPGKRVKTRRRTARVSFGFTAKHAVKTVCRLDKGDFSDCKSPARRKVGPGKHKFSVAGIDEDNRRGKAATYAFRVVRKR
jgi:hypothetical protein